jgi:hypothetical protein
MSFLLVKGRKFPIRGRTTESSLFACLKNLFRACRSSKRLSLARVTEHAQHFREKFVPPKDGNTDKTNAVVSELIETMKRAVTHAGAVVLWARRVDDFVEMRVGRFDAVNDIVLCCFHCAKPRPSQHFPTALVTFPEPLGETAKRSMVDVGREKATWEEVQWCLETFVFALASVALVESLPPLDGDVTDFMFAVGGEQKNARVLQRKRKLYILKQDFIGNEHSSAWSSR